MSSILQEMTSGTDELEEPTVFEELLRLSRDALAALEAGEVQEVERLLDLRKEIIASAPESPASGTAQETALAFARELQEADSRLDLALRSFQQALEADMTALDSGREARTAYFGGARSNTSIDIKR